MKKWYLYILKCSDDSLYTGITTNIKRRVKQHNLGKGAKSLRGKLPVKLVYSEEFMSQNEAAKREKAIKGWKREYKLKLISRGLPLKK
jgi:putative endonuclease